MRVVDTSAWIEWSTGTPIGRSLAQHLPERHDWLVPTMVQLELARWLTRERRETEISHIISFTQLCRTAPLSTEIAIAASEACRDHGLATADAIIFATARAHDAELLTCDRDFEDLPGVIFVPKT